MEFSRYRRCDEAENIFGDQVVLNNTHAMHDHTTYSCECLVLET